MTDIKSNPDVFILEKAVKATKMLRFIDSRPTENRAEAVAAAA